MAILNSSLQEFLQPFPTLTLEALKKGNWADKSWSNVLGNPASPPEPCYVVVGTDHQPLGLFHPQTESQESLRSAKLLKLPKVPKLPKFLGKPIKGRGRSKTKGAITTKDLEVFSLEPLASLTYQGDLLELWQQVQQELRQQPQRTWVLVDGAGKYLGVIDPWQLIQYLAPQLQLSPTPESIAVDPVLLYPSLIALLEQLPLPLMLQTQDGRVVSQNLAWRQQINSSLLIRTDLSLPQDQQLANLLCQPYPNSPTMETTLETFSPSSGKKNLEGSPIAGDPTTDSKLLRLKTPDRLWQLVKFPLQGELGQLQANPNTALWLVLATDITEQQQVAQELAAKNLDLVQLNRLKDEFLACISHELKTPLTAVLGLSSLLKEQSLGELNDRQSRYVHLIYQSGRQLMLVVNDILDLTRIETDQVELVPEPVNIASVCDRAYLQAQQRILSHHTKEVEDSLEQQFTLTIAPELQTVVADELRLRQILCHLLSNALKFTDPKGALGLEVSQNSHWIAFTVWDNGIGIPLDKQHLIFQKFQQLENPLTRRFNGTGLGLVLAQRLARLHGGDISFVSHPDRGSRFTLLLPAEDFWEEGTEGIHDINSAHPHEPSQLSQSFKSSKSSKPSNLVLVIEPVPQHVDNLSLHLEELGYCVVIARCGTEALEKARHLRPCLCFLNPLLPLLSGWDVLVLLKSDPQTQHIPILITATQGEKLEAYAHQADGFLNLPVEQSVLHQRLQQILQRDEGNFLDDRPISLTILILSPQASPLSPGQSADFSCLSSLLNQAIHQDPYGIKCRILEVDDLEQAELLAQVWHPDVLLFNGKEVVELTPYLEALAAHHSLAALPLITLDHAMTEAANSIGNLAVFPCLAADSCLFGSELNACYSLLQVIEVAIFSHQGKSF